MSGCAAISASLTGGAVSASMKKVLTIIVVIFLIFYLLTRPNQFADLLTSIWNAFEDAFDQIIKFIQGLG
jgi:hypothetical protein